MSSALLLNIPRRHATISLDLWTNLIGFQQGPAISNRVKQLTDSTDPFAVDNAIKIL